MILSSSSDAFRLRVPDAFSSQPDDTLTVLHTAFAAAPRAVFAADEQGAIVFANTAAASTFHYTAEELIGRPLSQLLCRSVIAEPESSNGDARSFAQTLEAMIGQPVNGIRSDGLTIPVELGVTSTADGGRRLLIVQAADLSERMQLEAQLAAAAEADLQFQRLVTDVAGRFVHVNSGRVDGAITDTLREIGATLQVDCAIVLCKRRGESVATATHWWQALTSDAPEALPAAASPWVMSRLGGGQPAWFASLDELPDPVDRASFRARGVRAGLFVPMPSIDDQKGTVRAVAFGSLTRNRDWPPTLVDRVRLVASIIGHALARQLDEAALERAIDELRQPRGRPPAQTIEMPREVKLLSASQSIIADSAAMQQVLAQVAQVAPTTSTVLLLGETGTGKALIAQAIHDLSPRHRRPLIRVSCATLPLSIVERELFGRDKDAHTGAPSRQMTRFDAAHQSTLFLDDIGELSLEGQLRLLQVLQDRVIERLGGTESITADLRIIAATNRNLEEAVQNQTFRDDLFHRLNVFPITIPPLRERVDDIPALVWSFVDEFSSLFGRKIGAVAPDSLRDLQRYSWPGNVRELRNLVERAVIVSTGRVLTLAPPRSAERSGSPPAMTLTALETEHIRAVLESTNWRIRGIGGAAERLGLKPTTLESRMARLGITRRKTG